MENELVKPRSDEDRVHPQHNIDQWGLFHHPRNDLMAFEFDGDRLRFTTRDGRDILVPLDWFPWLKKATPEQQQDFEVTEISVYFPQIDEGISMEPVLFGNPRLFTELSALPEISGENEE